MIFKIDKKKLLLIILILFFSLFFLFRFTFASANTLNASSTMNLRALQATPNTPNGEENLLYISREVSANHIQRTYMRFDVSSSTASVSSSTLSIFYASWGTNNPVGKEIKLYQLTQPAWDTNLCWNKYDATHSWVTPGGDYTVTGGCTIVLPNITPGVGQWLSCDIKDIVNNSIANYSGAVNLVLRFGDESTSFETYVVFDGHYYLSYAPHIEADYTPAPPTIDLKINSVDDITSATSTSVFLTGTSTLNIVPYKQSPYIQAWLYGGATSATSSMVALTNRYIYLPMATSTSVFYSSFGDYANGYYQFRDVRLCYYASDSDQWPTCYPVGAYTVDWYPLISNVFQINVSGNPLVNPTYLTTTSTPATEPLGGFAGWLIDVLKYLFFPDTSNNSAFSVTLTNLQDNLKLKFPFKYFYQIKSEIDAVSVSETENTPDLNITVFDTTMPLLSVSTTKNLITSTSFNLIYNLISTAMWFMLALRVLFLWREFSSSKDD